MFAAAIAGRDCRETYGRMPLAMDAVPRWAWRELGIVVRWSDTLPRSVDGLCFCVPRNGTRGAVVLNPRAQHPRFTVAHEIGHVMLRNGAAFSLSCGWPQPALPEREASAFAATLLIPDAEMRTMFADGLTLPQIAFVYDVAASVIVVRMTLARMLGEYSPCRLDGLLDALHPDEDAAP